jgi:hypothetical protein
VTGFINRKPKGKSMSSEQEKQAAEAFKKSCDIIRNSDIVKGLTELQIALIVLVLI